MPAGERNLWWLAEYQAYCREISKESGKMPWILEFTWHQLAVLS
jgi:hypothetical protein